MIFDQIQYAKKYATLGDRMAVALNYLAETDLAALPDGRQEIRADQVYALVVRYQTKPMTEGIWEAHHKYIDIQCVVQGRERIGVGRADDMTVTEDNPEQDYAFLQGQGQFLTLSPGDFAVLMPHEPHMPSIVVDEPSAVMKVVVKVLAS